MVCRGFDADEVVALAKVKHRIRRTVRIASYLNAEFTLNVGICRESGDKSHIPISRLIRQWLGILALLGHFLAALGQLLDPASETYSIADRKTSCWRVIKMAI